MPQNEYIDLSQKFNGKRLDFQDRNRRKLSRDSHSRTKSARNLRGVKAKIFSKNQISCKIKSRTHENKLKENVRSDNILTETALPTYLLERQTAKYKSIGNSLKKIRLAKNGKLELPIPKVQPTPYDEILKEHTDSKRRKKHWKRIVTKVTFVGPSFTRKQPKYDRFIRPTGMRMYKANVTHPELKTTIQLEILGVNKNPNGQIYSGLGVISLGTIIEVNVCELGIYTATGNIVWGKHAQVTNNPENDGVINAVLLI
jgi:ribosome biogenesis protein NSA2